MKHIQRLKIFMVAAVMVLTGCQPQPVEFEPISLDMWGMVDQEAALAPIIEAYQKMHPQVEISYRQIDEGVYEKRLLNALAEDRGPDIFMVPHVKLRDYKKKLAPMPKTVTIRELQEEQPIEVNRKSMNMRDLQNRYFEIVKQYVVMPHQETNELGEFLPPEERIWGLPFSSDTLVMYYNEDLLKKFDLAEPPRTWTQFTEVVRENTQKTSSNRILQSVAAIGTTNNVRHATELITTLMQQIGAVMIDDSGTIRFAQTPPGVEIDEPPALRALQFYVDFASPFKEAYTWNKRLTESRQSFIQGRTAFYFGFAEDYAYIKENAPKLNFAPAPIPQVAGNRVLNTGKFNAHVVSAKSDAIDYAWDFIQFVGQNEQTKAYVDAMQLPTPIRSLVPIQQEDELMGPFADQLLTMRSWYQGDNYDEAVDAFDDLIDDIHNGKYEFIQEAVNNAANVVAETYYDPVIEE